MNLDNRLDIRVIVAVGRSGQIGLNNRLPWKNAEDMDFFKSQIKGGIVILGHKTAENMPKLFDCEVDIWESSAKRNPNKYIRYIEDSYKNWPKPPTLWIAGGVSIYEQWAPYVKRLVVSQIDYDGPCDARFPWNAYQKPIFPPNDFTSPKNYLFNIHSDTHDS